MSSEYTLTDSPTIRISSPFFLGRTKFSEASRASMELCLRFLFSLPLSEEYFLLGGVARFFVMNFD